MKPLKAGCRRCVRARDVLGGGGGRERAMLCEEDGVPSSRRSMLVGTGGLGGGRDMICGVAYERPQLAEGR